MKYIRVTRSDTPYNYTQELWGLGDAIEAEFDDFPLMSTGTSVTLTVVEMSEEEYAALPEFEE